MNDKPIIRDYTNVFPCPVGHRYVYRTSDIEATEPPNMGLSLACAFDMAASYKDCEGLLIIESDVIIRPGCVEALIEAAMIDGPECGSVAPLYVELGGNTVSSVGGMTKEKVFCNIPVGIELGSWDQSGPPTLDYLWWAHNACLWLPRSTITNPKVRPDPNFRLFYADHDLSYTIRTAGLRIVVTDRAVAEHSRNCASTQILWRDESMRSNIEMDGYEMLKRKWPGFFTSG
jgi:GT2 family glycosyltransferase